MSRPGEPASARRADPAALLVLAERAARDAGRLLVTQRPDVLTTSTKSTPTDVVTEMDTAAERLITAALLAERPDDGILGEEGAGRAGSSGVRWVVDPIDGTVNYLYGIPQWAVSIAAEVDGEMVAGAVFDPSKGEMFTAVAGAGAFLDGARLEVSGCTSLDQALVGTGFGYAASRRASQARVLAELLPQVRDVRRMGAASLDLCALACGRLDGYYERGLAPWDHAAAGLIAREAGARVEGLDGRHADDALVVGAGALLFPALHDLLARLRADRD